MSNASIFRSTIYLLYYVLQLHFQSSPCYWLISCYKIWILTTPASARDNISWWRLLPRRGEEQRPGRAERERAWSSWRTRGGGRPCCKTGGKHWTSGERWDRLINYIPFLHLSLSITEIKGPCWSPVNPEITIRKWWDQWKTDLSLPQLQPSEGGKSPLKAATGNWGVIQTSKQIRRRTA